MPSKILDDLVSATKALIKDIVADEVSDESNGAINDKSAEIVVDAASDTIDNIARTSPDSRQKTDLLGKKIQIAEIAQETQEFYERDDLDTIQKNVLSTINILNKFFPFSGDATVIAEKAIELRNKRVGELEKIMSEYPEHFMRVPDHLKEIKKLPASTDTTPTTEFDGADARASHPTRVKLPENLPGSPLIADREGDGISVSFLETSNTWFDIDADGFRELLAWPDGLDDWILVLDWNGNGVIDDSTEWFGGLETDGFAELANLDNNKDGHIDLADAQFADLLFWADINQDGVSDPGELTPVQNEVLYIDLNASLINEINNGNPVTHRSAVQWLDGTTTNIDDIWFRFDQWDSRSKDESIDGISDDVLVLPELIGRGDMASLWQAMSENSDLKQSALSLLESLENGDIDGYLNQFDFFLLQWAGVDTKDMVTPTTVNTPEMLSFLRAFSGRDYDAWTGNLGVNATALVEKNFDDISGSLAARFAFQAPISSFLMSEDSETFAFNHPLSVLMSIFDYNPQTDMLSLRENNSTLSFEALIQDNVLTLSQAFNLLRLFAPDVAAQDTDLSELSGGTHVAIVHAGLSHGHYYDLDQGTDRVPGGPNADIFQGGGGDDTLLGQGGKDVFIWSKGHGNDVIHDDGTGQLILTDVLADGVEIARSQNNSSDVVIKILETSETILLENLLTSQSHGIQSLVFRDGTSMERAAIEEAAWFRGSSKTEYFWGYAADEIFIGGGGDDTIHGGCGKDVFLWSLYHGNDVIRDDGSGHLVLQDVSSEQVVFGRAEAAANDLTIGVTETNETILIKNFFWNETQGIDRLTFKDGSSLDRNGIISAVQNAEATAPPPHEISSISLNSSGQDQFSWTKGSGDYLISGQGSGRVFLRDVAPEGVVFGRSFNYRNNLEITVTETGETLTVKQFFNNWNNGIQSITFGDGTSMDRTALENASWYRGGYGQEIISGSGTAETFLGSGGGDRIYGGGGEDTFLWSKRDGNDIIHGDGTGRLVLQDVARDGVEISRHWNNRYDLALRILETDEIIIINQFFSNWNNGIDSLVFNDGSTMGRDTLKEAAWYRGGPGTDLLSGSASADTFLGNAGDDQLNGAGGTDRFLWSVGNGNDVIRGDGSGQLVLQDVRPDGVQIGRSIKDRNDLAITVLETGETVIIKNFMRTGQNGIDSVLFSDGTTMGRTVLEKAAWYRGGPASDALFGTSEAETFIGGALDDQLFGGGGADTFLWSRGDGNDTIISNGQGALILQDVTKDGVEIGRSLTNSRDLTVTILETGEILFIRHFGFGPNHGIDRLVFSDGTMMDRASLAQNAWYRGSASADSLFGNADAETFLAGTGNDRIHSGDGADTFIWSPGDGNDTIYNAGSGRLVLHKVLADEVAITPSPINSRDLKITVLETGETILVKNFNYGSNLGIDSLVFGDGTMLDRTGLVAAMAQSAQAKPTVNTDRPIAQGPPSYIDVEYNDETVPSAPDLIDWDLWPDPIPSPNWTDLLFLGTDTLTTDQFPPPANATEKLGIAQQMMAQNALNMSDAEKVLKFYDITETDYAITGDTSIRESGQYSLQKQPDGFWGVFDGISFAEGATEASAITFGDYTYYLTDEALKENGFNPGQLKDYDGNALGAEGDWQLAGIADVDGDGTQQYLLTNPTLGRWASVNGDMNTEDHGVGGATRVVGIYIDPLVESGEVEQGSAFDSQTRFANDLKTSNLYVLGNIDGNGDGYQDVFFRTTDGTAYLRAVMHQDGNIQYANYMNWTQLEDWMETNGVQHSFYSDWDLL